MLVWAVPVLVVMTLLSFLSGFALDNMLITVVTIILLLTKKIPAPLIVLGILMMEPGH